MEIHPNGMVSMSFVLPSGQVQIISSNYDDDLYLGHRIPKIRQKPNTSSLDVSVRGAFYRFGRVLIVGFLEIGVCAGNAPGVRARGLGQEEIPWEQRRVDDYEPGGELRCRSAIVAF